MSYSRDDRFDFSGRNRVNAHNRGIHRYVSRFTRNLIKHYQNKCTTMGLDGYTVDAETDSHRFQQTHGIEQTEEWFSFYNHIGTMRFFFRPQTKADGASPLAHPCVRCNGFVKKCAIPIITPRKCPGRNNFVRSLCYPVASKKTVSTALRSVPIDRTPL